MGIGTIEANKKERGQAMKTESDGCKSRLCRVVMPKIKTLISSAPVIHLNDLLYVL